MTTSELTRDQQKVLFETIVEAFDREHLEELLQLDLDKQISHLVPEKVPDRVAVLRIIGKARKEGWLLSFVEACQERRPQNEHLKHLFHVLQQPIKRKNVSLPPKINPPLVDPYEVRLLQDEQDQWAIVDRHLLRQALKQMNEDDRRILVVDGDRLSGKSHSVRLIRYLKAGKVLVIDLRRMAEEDKLLVEASDDKGISATDIGQEIALKWGLEGMPSPQSEQDTFWARVLCRWLTDQLENFDTLHWIVFDHFDKAILTPAAHHLILRIAASIYSDLPMLRLVLIEYKDKAKLQRVLIEDEGKNSPESQEPDPPIEYERIPNLETDDLMIFFVLEYEERKQRQGISYHKEHVAESIARVMRRVPSDSERRLEFLGTAVTDEAIRIAAEGN